MFKTISRLLCAVALAPAAVSAHDDGKGNIIMPAFEFLQQELAGVVASSANFDSNAPKGFAPCIDGMAADSYPCDGIDMMSHLSHEDLGLSFVNDMWGWTDPETNRDYALVGGGEGMVVVDISDPKRPVVNGILPARFSVSRIIWRDIKTYANHAFVVSEDSGSGLQVMDLTQVRGYSGTPMEFSETATSDAFDHAHNINVNETTGTAYVIGADTCGGGLHMFDISIPSAPVDMGCGSYVGYVHDTQCVTYEGPDSDYTGREICFNSAAQGVFVGWLDIVDVTDKGNPVQLGRIGYPGNGYSHQGWLSEDQGLFFHNDELDEAIFQKNTTTRIFDVSDLDNPSLLKEVEHGTTAIGHNAYTEGQYLFAANYTSGLRIYDTTFAEEGELPEVAWFDVYPANDNARFEGGAWSSYPFFHQKKIVAVSSMERGLFILRARIGN